MPKLQVALLVFSLIALSEALNCTTTVGGKPMTFDSIIAPSGSYLLKQSNVYNTEGNLFSALGSGDLVSLVFELQLCQPITNSISPNCTTPGSVANMINTDGSCVSLGIDAASTFNPNPYNDGVFIAAYNGNSTDHITKYSSFIYLICDPKQEANVAFEHIKSTLQVHFSVYTKLAC